MTTGLTLREVATAGFDSLYAWGLAPVLFLPPNGEEVLPGLDAASTTAELKTRDFRNSKPELSPTMLVVPVIKTGRNPFATTISVGRIGVNDVQIKHPTISKVHAWLLRPTTENGAWRLMDVDSMNGTYANSARLAPSEQMLIRSGDLISFGSVQTMFVDHAEAHELLVSFARRYNGEGEEDTARAPFRS
jgi:hypothetical protein